jgi:hypothetical protein
MALLTRSFPCALTLCAAGLLACTAKPTDEAETDGSTGTDPTTTTSGGDSTSTSGDGTTGTPGTTTDPIDPSTGEGSAGFITPPDGGSYPAGYCLGQRRVGYLATVHGPDEPAVCNPEPMNCGADPVGTWTVQEHCGFEALPNFFADQCPESTMQVLDSAVEGTRTFGEDSSYSESFTLTIETQFDLDSEACFGLACAEFGQAIDSEEQLSASCSEVETGCRCSLTITDEAHRQGTYSVTEGGVVVDAEDSSSDPIPFCLDGDTLTVWDPLVETRSRQDIPCDVPQDCEAALDDEPETTDFEWYCVI